MLTVGAHVSSVVVQGRKPPLPALAPYAAWLDDDFVAGADAEITARAPAVGAWLKSASPSWTGTINAIASTKRAAATSATNAFYMLSTEAPTTDYEIEAAIRCNVTGGTFSSGALVFRALTAGDRSGYQVQLYNEQLRFLRAASTGAGTLIDSTPQVSMSLAAGEIVWLTARVYTDDAGDVCCTAEVNGRPIVWSISGTTIAKDASGSKITRAGRPAMLISGQTCDIVRFRAGPIESVAAIIVSPYAEDVRQRDVDSAEVSIFGVTGFAATSWTGRIIDEVTKAVVVDDFAIAASRGQFAATVTVPEGGLYVLEVRRTGDATRVFRRRFGVGIRVLNDGQSNRYRFLGSNGGGSGAPTKSRVVSDARGWGSIPNRAGLRMMAQLDEQLFGVPIGYLHYALPGTEVDTWLGGGTSWAAMVDPVSGILQPAVGPRWEIERPFQGEADTANDSYESFKAKHLLLKDQLDALNEWGSAVRFLAQIGTLGSTSAGADGIRKALFDLPLEDARFRHGPAPWGAEMSDFIHYAASDTGYGRIARRDVQASALEIGAATYGARGPIVVGATATAGGTRIIVEIEHEGGTALRDTAGGTSGAGITGFVAVDGVTPLTISATSFLDGNHVGVDLASPLVNTTGIAVGYLIGGNPVTTLLIVDNTTPRGDTMGLPLRPTPGLLPVMVA